ncbi:MAG: HAMP domain-containing sensor histidine kinase [Desulfobacterales bacterium]
MMTNPKTGDYLTWFFGTGEHARGQMANFLKQRSPVVFRPLPNGKNLPRPYVDFEPTIEFVSSGGPAAVRELKDIVELIKRARRRMDRSHAVLKRKSGQATHLVTAGRSALEVFLVGIAHHFNNLFMTIQGNVSLILGATVGDHRHDRRIKRLEQLVASESMLTNDLLGIVIEKGCNIDGQLQAHLLDEIIAISDTVAMRRAFCGLEGPARLTPAESRRALRRFGDSLILILQRLLTEIEEHTAFIMADDSADEAEKARLHKIMATIDRGQHLLNDLRYYCGGSVPVAKRIGTETLAEVVRVTCCGKREDIDCHLTIAPDCGAVEMDGGWLYIILQKLYDNAADAMPHGGDLFVEIENVMASRLRQKEKESCARSYVRLKFKDTGQGMAAEALPRIFDPFYKTKPEKFHRGLGLAVVDGLVQTTGGRIGVESIPGKGTTFTLDLPAAKSVTENQPVLF